MVWWWMWCCGELCLEEGVDEWGDCGYVDYEDVDEE